MTDQDLTIRDSAEQIAHSANHSSVKRPILDNTLGFLNSTPPVAVLNEEETPRLIFFNRREGVEVHNETSETHEPSETRGTLLLITDERVLILIGKEETDECISIPYGLIEEASCRFSTLGSLFGSIKSSQININTVDEDYRIPVIKANREDLSKGVSYIEGYSYDVTGGEVEQLDPDTDYNPRTADSSKKYKTILVCRKCSEEVSRGIERCPHCGFDPQENTRGATWKTAAAGLSFTILAPVGLAMGYDSAKKTHNAKKDLWVEKTIEVSENKAEDRDNTESNPEESSPNNSSAKKLRELKELLEEEVITEDEFEEQKHRILSDY